jgi:hypothetical protein
VLLLFGAGWLLRTPESEVGWLPLVLECLAAALALVATWLGGARAGGRAETIDDCPGLAIPGALRPGAGGRVAPGERAASAP